MAKIVVKKVDPSASGSRWLFEEALRKTEVAYILDRELRSSEYWYEQICSPNIGIKEFRLRVKQGNWQQRRQEHWDAIKQEILRRAKYVTVNARLGELSEVLQLRNDTLEILKPYTKDGKKIFPVAPSTREGMTRAFIALDQLGDAKRDSVLTLIEPELSQEDKGSQVASIFAPDEARAVSEFLVSLRRKKQQLQIASGKPEPEDADPDS